MDWGKLYKDLPDDPRVQAAEDQCAGAAWLLVSSMCYCTGVAETMPDRYPQHVGYGFIPETQVSRFGGRRLAERVRALVAEGLWIKVDHGYLIDPRIWSEDRNLSDSAEKRRASDAERQRRHRAAKASADKGSSDDRAPASTAPVTPSSRDTSRDSHAPVSVTTGVTVTPPARDGHAPKRKEKDKTSPPTPPAAMKPLWPAAVPDVQQEEGENSSPPSENRDIPALAGELHKLRPDWTTAKITQALTRPGCAERPWGLVCEAARLLAADETTDQPGRIAVDGPWWAQAARQLRQHAQPPPEPTAGQHAYEAGDDGACRHCDLPEANRRHRQARAS